MNLMKSLSSLINNKVKVSKSAQSLKKVENLGKVEKLMKKIKVRVFE